MIRRLLERLVRGRSFRRRLPAAFGRRPVYVTPDAALAYLKPGWDRSIRDLMAVATTYVREGDAVWDIGGNCGLFALAAAHRAGAGGQTLVLEPDLFLASLLQRTVSCAENADREIAVLCAAAGDRGGIGRFLVAARGRASNALEQTGQRSEAGGVRAVHHVPIVTLDSLLGSFRPPRLVKIDVEGAEAIVLRGAERILREVRPAVHIEVGEESADEVTAILHRHGYRLTDADGDADHEIARCVFNTLALPADGTTHR